MSRLEAHQDTAEPSSSVLSDRRQPVVMISGASRGLGSALARSLGKRGARISLCARTRTVTEVARQLRIRDIDCLAVRADVTQPDEVRSWLSRTVDRFDRVDVLVNNAAIFGPPARLEELKLDDWFRVIDVNLTAPFICFRTVLPHLKRSQGCLLNVLSHRAFEGPASWGSYAVSKAGLAVMTRQLSREWSAEDLLVVGVNPGVMATGLRDDALGSSSASGSSAASPEDVGERMAEVVLGLLRSDHGRVIDCFP